MRENIYQKLNNFSYHLREISTNGLTEREIRRYFTSNIKNLLIQRGVNTLATDHMGKTALDYAPKALAEPSNLNPALLLISITS